METLHEIETLETELPPKKPSHPKGIHPDVEEFMKNPVQYAADRGVRNLRNLRIVPTRTQERLADGTFGEKFVDILRSVKLNKSRDYSGHGINARKRK